MDKTSNIDDHKPLPDNDIPVSEVSDTDIVVSDDMPNRFFQMSHKYVAMTDHIKCHYIARVMETGLLTKSALYVGVAIETARAQRINDEEFGDAVQMALQVYRDVVAGEIHRRGITGVDQPVFYMGEQCGVIRKYSDRLLEMHAKRHMTEYRDHQTTDVNVTGGVMIIPAGPQSVEAWEEENDAPLDVIDVTEVEEIPEDRTTERA